MPDYGTFEPDLPIETFSFEGGAGNGTRILYTGEQGPAGPVSAIYLKILGAVPTTGDLPASGKPGEAWKVETNNHYWVWNPILAAWDDIGVITGTGVQSSDGTVTDVRVMTMAAFTALPSKNATTIYGIKS